MAMTAWLAKFLTNSNLLVGERAHFPAVHDNRADQFGLLEHWYGDVRSCAAKRSRRI
jgi:hypothetical protein